MGGAKKNGLAKPTKMPPLRDLATRLKLSCLHIRGIKAKKKQGRAKNFNVFSLVFAHFNMYFLTKDGIKNIQ
jgi:hypothetical protein